MKRRQLGNTDINVTEICLGTMTWGQQNTQAEGFEQMDYALERGIDFFDTAELYPVPPMAETYTRTETIIGNWFKERGTRNKVFLASKIAGRAPNLHWIRDGQTKFNRETIRGALENSLNRLRTDYVDLYQLHWPERVTNFFGVLGYRHVDKEFTPLVEAVETMGELIREGKIRHWGLSNETAWGTMKFLQIADQLNLPRPVTVQNPYSLLNRSYEVGLAEVSHREQIGLLAYSPLAFGVLSGKYIDGKDDKNSRLNLFGKHFSRYNNDEARAATREYMELARAHNLTPTQLALAFVTSRSFLTSNIIGATSMEQLKENIATAEVSLDKPLIKEIEKIHKRWSNPAP